MVGRPRLTIEIRSIATLLVKVAVAFSLCYWLVVTGQLDPGALSILVRSEWVLGSTVLLWLVVTVGFSTVRWQLLLGATGSRQSWPKAIGLQMMALFFNGVVPGNVGGDFLKNLYVGREGFSRIMVLVLSERLVGLSGLIWVAIPFVGLRAPDVVAEERLVPLVAVLVGLAFSSLVLPLLLLWWMGSRHQGAERTEGGEARSGERSPWGNGSTAHAERRSSFRLFAARKGHSVVRPFRGKGGRTPCCLLVRIHLWMRTSSRSWLRARLAATTESLRLLQRQRARLLGAWGLSLLIHGSYLLYFWFLSQTLHNPAADFSRIALVFPLGMLTMILPISFAGLGVGHVAFERLFALVGLSGGANVFNVYIVGVLAPTLTGAVPYLLLKRKT